MSEAVEAGGREIPLTELVNSEMRSVRDFWISLELTHEGAMREQFPNMVSAFEAFSHSIDPAEKVGPDYVFCRLVYLTDLLNNSDRLNTHIQQIPFDPLGILDLADIAELVARGWQDAAAGDPLNNVTSLS